VEVGHASVSPVHAAVINSGSKTFVQDLGSKHGTALDGVPLIPHKATEVAEDSVIVFGKADVVYVARGVKPTPRKAAAQAMAATTAAAAPLGQWVAPPWATPSSMSCELHDVSTGKTWPIEKAASSTVIGRHGELSDLIVLHDTVSRRHAAIVHREEESFLYDLGSTHGTFLDQKRIESNRPVRLDGGARIKVGSSKETFVFRSKKHRALKRPRAEEASHTAAEAEAHQEQEPEREPEPAGPSQLERDLLEGKDIGNDAAVAYDPLAAIFSKRNQGGGAAGGGGDGGFSWADAFK